MPIPTSDLTTLRKYPHRSNLYLLIQQPRVVWSGFVSSVPQQSDDPITSISVVSQNNATLLDGMTAVFHKGLLQPGEIQDKFGAIVRVHGDQVMQIGPARKLYVAPSSDLYHLADYRFVSVLDEFRFWPRYPRVAQSGNGVVWYKDYGIFRNSLGGETIGLDFSQIAGTAIYPPMPIMGTHRVLFLEPGQSSDVYFDWSDSYSPAPEIFVNGWSSRGISGPYSEWTSTAQTPGYKTYSNVSGMRGYRVTLEVSTSGDDPIVEFRRGVRYVFTLRKPGQRQQGDPEDAEPITEFEVSSITGSFDFGGWRAVIRLFQTAVSKYTILPGALVILFAEDYYGDEARSIGPIPGSENIVFIGRIADGTITMDSETGDVVFDAVSFSDQASKRENYAVPIEDAASPVEWYQAQDLTVDRAAAWLVSWHSTLPLVTDFYLIGENVRIKAQDFLASDFYSMINSFLDDRRYARLLFDRYGRAKCEINLAMRDEGDGVEHWALADGDWFGEIEFKETNETRTSLVHGGGIIYDGSNITPALSNAPGSMAKYAGTVTNKTNLAVVSQDELNKFTGSHLARDNLRFRVSFTTGNWRYPDIWPQGYVLITRDIARKQFTNARFIVRTITYEYRDGALTARYDLDEDAHGPPGIGVGISSSLPAQPPSSTEPVNQEALPSRPQVNRFRGVIIAASENGIWYTNTLAETETTWSRLGSGVNGQTVIDMIFVDEGNRQMLYALTTSGIWKYSSLPVTNGSWSQVWSNPGLTLLAIHNSPTFPKWFYWTTRSGLYSYLYWTSNEFTSVVNDQISIGYLSQRIGVWSSPSSPRTVYLAGPKREGVFVFTYHLLLMRATISADNSEISLEEELEKSDNNHNIATDGWVYVPKSNASRIFYGSRVPPTSYPDGYPFRYSTNGGASFSDGASVIGGIQACGIANYDDVFSLRTYYSRGDLLRASTTNTVPMNADAYEPRAAIVQTRSGKNILSILITSGTSLHQVTSSGGYYTHSGNKAYTNNITAIAHYEYAL